MCTINEMLERFRSFNPVEVAGSILAEKTDEVEDIIRGQLMDGKDSLGQLITPTYSQDPFFKKEGAAQRYAQWKADLFPNSTKPFDTPNLIITGEFHRSITVSIQGENVVYDSSIGLGADIMAKYGDTIIGLNDEGKKKAWQDLIREEFVRILADETQCPIS